jgi:eukaryotic-like serine/threonine-protein kinase
MPRAAAGCAVSPADLPLGSGLPPLRAAAAHPAHGAPPAAEVGDPRVGRAFGDKWQIDAVIGAGGVATVYAATHRNRRRAAIKVMHARTAADAESRARFLREGYAANSVVHRGIVSVLDDDVTDDGCPYLVMELLEGESIEQRWQRKGCALPVGEVLSIVDQVLDALAVAHDVGVVHRDLKPANLFLCTDGTIKLLDFGLARTARSGKTTTFASSATMGTPAFMAPEQALGRTEAVGARTDLWAVGATMITLLSGRHVHEAATVNEMLLSAMTREAPASVDVVPGLPRGVARIVDRALAFEPQGRWSDAREMQLAVREAYRAWASMMETRQGPPPARASREGKRARMDTVLGAVRIGLAAFLGITWGTQMASGDVQPASHVAAGALQATAAEAARAAAGDPKAPITHSPAELADVDAADAAVNELPGSSPARDSRDPRPLPGPRTPPGRSETPAPAPGAPVTP